MSPRGSRRDARPYRVNDRSPGRAPNGRRAAGSAGHSPGGRRGASCGRPAGGGRPAWAASEEAQGEREARGRPGAQEPAGRSQKRGHGTAGASRRLHAPPEGQEEHVTSGSPGAGETKAERARRQGRQESVFAWTMELPTSPRRHGALRYVSGDNKALGVVEARLAFRLRTCSPAWSGAAPLRRSVGRVRRGQLLPGERRSSPGPTGENPREPRGRADGEDPGEWRRQGAGRRPWRAERRRASCLLGRSRGSPEWGAENRGGPWAPPGDSVEHLGPCLALRSSCSLTLAKP